MKKIIFLISLSVLLTSCCNEPVDFKSDNNYSIALDTLKNYNDYILGDFNGKFLVSTNVFTRGFSASTISMPIDSSYIQFQLAYKLLDNNVEKSVFVSYRLLESKTKLDTNNHHKYKYFSDFINFFDRDTFEYYQINQPIENVHNVWIKYQNYYDINNDVYSYSSSEFDQQITPENFKFKVDSINIIESPIKKVEVYYSFKCLGVNFYANKLKIENGKGKSTFEFN